MGDAVGPAPEPPEPPAAEEDRLPPGAPPPSTVALAHAHSQTSPATAFALPLARDDRARLAASLVAASVAALPVAPARISGARGPRVQVSRVAGDAAALDICVTHHFRAHYGAPELAAGDARVEELGAAASAASADGLAGLSSSSDATGSFPPDPSNFPTDLAHVARSLYRFGDAGSGAPAAPPAAAAAHRDCGGGGGGGGNDCGDCGGPALAPWELAATDVRIGERLAVGGFAEVFLGKFQGTLVAVKVLLNVDAAGRRRFLREVATMASLRHPNLLLFMGFVCRPAPAIVTEFMHRGSLFRVLSEARRRAGFSEGGAGASGSSVGASGSSAGSGGAPAAAAPRPPPRLARAVAAGVARGMAALHARRPPLLHLDLKSPNILLDKSWNVKVADFGLSRLKREAGAAAPSGGAGAGTPEWMAPELLRGEPVGEAADVFSYGVVLWEVLTGRAPWAELLPVQVVAAVGFQGRELPPLPPGADPVLASLCTRCLAPAPAARPSFADVVAELEAAFSPARLHASLVHSLSDAGPAAAPAPPTPAPRGGAGAAAPAAPAPSAFGLDDGSPFAAAGLLPLGGARGGAFGRPASAGSDYGVAAAAGKLRGGGADVAAARAGRPPGMSYEVLSLDSTLDSAELETHAAAAAEAGAVSAASAAAEARAVSAVLAAAAAAADAERLAAAMATASLYFG